MQVKCYDCGRSVSTGEAVRQEEVKKVLVKVIDYVLTATGKE